MNKETKPTTFVTKIDLKLGDKLLTGLKSQGFEISTPQYTVFSGKKKGVSCTLYQSGKLMVQGKEMADFMEFYLEPEILGTFAYSYQDLNIDKTGRIGIDEAGKGDFFGPLCIAGVYAEAEVITKLQEIGVKDSKSMSDKVIYKLAREIQKISTYHVVKINPGKYNELYQKFRNLNHLLAWGHATAIENLLSRTPCTRVIIDQFANERVVEKALEQKKIEVDLTQRHRGEEDIVVAAASILARHAFLDGLEKLSERCGVELRKGASKMTIEAGRAFIRKHGKDALIHVAKLHFKTLESVLEGEHE